ncbi:MAG: acetate/propionate family kinase [Gammaproteobacteria bacterium]|nr:acetate/propionate family kinase [Gammaproteobacteria bacterium]
MNILIINAGSSSLRLSIIASNNAKLYEVAAELYDRHSLHDENALQDFLEQNIATKIDIIAHRFVHGGNHFEAPCLIDDEVLTELEKLSALAPLHNPPALILIRLAQTFFNEEMPQIAVFDTMFFHQLPAVAQSYALPSDLVEKYQIRRYGFHGLAHQYMLEQWQQHNPEKSSARVITLQLGSGCSITAIRDGKVIDTSMGFSPMEGLVMSTRCGDLDPGLILYLQQQAGLTATELETLLNNQSGLLGLSNMSKDMRELLESNFPQAKLAVEVFCYRIKKYLGAYIAAMGGVDAIVFGGGIGENSSEIRAKVLEGLLFLHIVVDDEQNKNSADKTFAFHAKNSHVSLWTVPVNEAFLMARLAQQCSNETLCIQN